MSAGVRDEKFKFSAVECQNTLGNIYILQRMYADVAANSKVVRVKMKTNTKYLIASLKKKKIFRIIN